MLDTPRNHASAPVRRNPYAGPRPFGPQERAVFAGRQLETEELASYIVAHRAVLLYAQSGAGKTSLVQAAVLPELMDKGVHVLPVTRVGIPPPALAGSPGNVFVFSAVRGLLPDPDNIHQLSKLNIADALALIPRETDEFGEPRLRVLAFDQFEELFTAFPDKWSQRREFFEQAASALERDPSLRMLFVLREDYLADFVEFADILPEGIRTRYRLQRLRQPEAIEAVVEPLRGSSCSYAEGVAENLVSDLLRTTTQVEGRTENVAGEFVEPVQLQVVCYTLFENLPEGRTVISGDDLRQFGNTDEALGRFYDQAVGETVSKGADEAQVRDWLENRLITSAGTRGMVFQGTSETGGLPNQYVEALQSAHLIRAEARSGGRWYELTHDRFIGPVRASNRAWQEKYAARRVRTILGGVLSAALLAFALIAVLMWVYRSQVAKARSDAARAEKRSATLAERADSLQRVITSVVDEGTQKFHSLRETEPAVAIAALDQAIGALKSINDPKETELKRERLDFLDGAEVHKASRTVPAMKEYLCDHEYAVLGESGSPSSMAAARQRYSAEFPLSIIRNSWGGGTASALLLDRYLSCDQAMDIVKRVRARYRSDPLIVLLYRCKRGECVTPPK